MISIEGKNYDIKIIKRIIEIVIVVLILPVYLVANENIQSLSQFEINSISDPEDTTKSKINNLTTPTVPEESSKTISKEAQDDYVHFALYFGCISYGELLKLSTAPIFGIQLAGDLFKPLGFKMFGGISLPDETFNMRRTIKVWIVQFSGIFSVSDKIMSPFIGGGLGLFFLKRHSIEQCINFNFVGGVNIYTGDHGGILLELQGLYVPVEIVYPKYKTEVKMSFSWSINIGCVFKFKKKK